ncbi:S1 family peptidase [Nocardia mexicana]|uniref:Trypsin-like peptidase n=1 Tax=Nocardia mexicana TaxID=279262 RepID=A0A370HDI8_9NOCA|nr:serine protease [Nocardia mexicana]RDI55307.1 trypsin-like peptidase [Nocardia mexicana]
MQGIADNGRLGWATVRILTPSGEVVGAGFLVRPTLIATCAHVVSAALNRETTGGEAPEEPVAVDFASAGTAREMLARVRHWSGIGEDGRGDIAILELLTPPPDSVAPLPFWPAGQPWGGEFRMFGFPAEMPGGVWVSGEFRAPQSQGWMQLQAATGGQPITEGFSGAAVWDTEAHAVTGMAVAADRRRYTRTAFMLPIDEVLRLDPGLLSSPYRGMAPFDEEHAEFFYGRDDDIARVLETLRHNGFAAVVGRSGTGKSSLIRAGVIPRLRQQGREVAAFRLSGDAATASGVRAIGSGLATDEPLSTWLIEQTAPDAADAPAAELLQRLPSHGTVLFVDQFEDLAAASPRRARALLQALIRLTRADADGRLAIVLTLRWDALDDLLDTELAEFLGGTTVAVAPLGRTQLRDVISRPAGRAGVVLDDAVIERLIDGVFDQPGGLPLLASVLSDLWARHTGGRITLADYEDVGSVEVSIARRAEQVMAQFTDPAAVSGAERLLKLLAVPTSSGAGFVRSVLPMRQYPELRDVAGRLALDRLVVVGRDKNGADTVELAHQALIDNWERLHDLLQSDRDFRTWQQHLAQDLDNWERRGREPDALLRGTALEAASEQLEARESDVPQAHREFIAASRRRRGREVRRLRLVAAALAVLVVVATTTAVLAYRSSEARAAQLRLQAGRNLAEESMRVADSDLDRALQLAQAAARHAPDDPLVRTALLYQQVRMSSVDDYRTDLWHNATFGAASGDGSEFAVAEDRDVTVWSGLSGDNPVPWRLPPTPRKVVALNLSPNGAALAVVTDDGAVSVWDVRSRTGPAAVRPPEPAPLLNNGVSTGWDEAGRRLAVRLNRAQLQQAEPEQAEHTDLLEVYDLAGARPVPIASPPPLADVAQFPRYVDPTGTMIAMREVRAGAERNVLRDAQTGQPIRELPPGTITSTGLIAGCTDDQLVVADALTGAERTRTPRGSGTRTEDCEWDIDLSGRYAWSASALTTDTIGQVHMIELRTGRASVVQAATIRRKSGVSVLISPGADGPRLAQFTPSGMLRFAPAVAIAEMNVFAGSTVGNRLVQWGPDGRFVVEVERLPNTATGTIRVVEMAPAIKEVARTSTAITMRGSAPYEAAYWITTDGRHLVTAGTAGGITVYSLPGLAVERQFSLPFPPELEPGRRSPTSIMQPGDDELAFFYAGTVTRWRISNGQQLGGPLRTWRDVEELRWMVDRGVQAHLVPTHKDRFFTENIDGDTVRDLLDGRVIRTIPVNQSERYDRREGFARPGVPGIYIRYDSGKNTIENFDTGVESVSPQPFPAGRPAGETKDGLVVVNNGAGLEIWDFDRATKLFDVKVTAENEDVFGDTLHLLNPGRYAFGGGVGKYAINLDRDEVLERLCAINDREYTPAERDALPVGADTTRPCRGT